MLVFCLIQLLTEYSKHFKLVYIEFCIYLTSFYNETKILNYDIDANHFRLLFTVLYYDSVYLERITHHITFHSRLLKGSI